MNKAELVEAMAKKTEQTKKVTEESLNYLLAYIQTKNKVTNDKRIVFYIGEKYVVLDTILSPQNHNKNKKYGLEQSNKML